MNKGEIINFEKLKHGRDMQHEEFLKFLSAHGSKFWSWGARGFTKINTSTLRFRVSGHHHKGHVYIFLNGLDVFEVYLTTISGKIVEVIEDLYIDNIFSVLDERIEKIADYKF